MHDFHPSFEFNTTFASEHHVSSAKYNATSNGLAAEDVVAPILMISINEQLLDAEWLPVFPFYRVVHWLIINYFSLISLLMVLVLLRLLRHWWSALWVIRSLPPQLVAPLSSLILSPTSVLNCLCNIVRWQLSFRKRGKTTQTFSQFRTAIIPIIKISSEGLPMKEGSTKNLCTNVKCTNTDSFHLIN